MSDLILPYKTRFNPELPIEAIQEWERKEAKKSSKLSENRVNEKYSDPKKPSIYVFPDPIIKINNGKYEVHGEYVRVSEHEKALDYLKNAGCYNSKVDVGNGFVSFSDNFSSEGCEDRAKCAFYLIDKDALLADLKNGYAFLKTKDKNQGEFENHQNTKFMAKMNKITQDILYKMLSEDMKRNFRHMPVQEGVEKMYSDDNFKDIMSNYWICNREMILKFEERNGLIVPIQASSTGSLWNMGGARPDVNTNGPLHWLGFGVAGLVED